MDGITISKYIGEISEDIIAQGLTPPVPKPRKKALRRLLFAAVFVFAFALGVAVASRLIGLFVTNNQHAKPFLAKDVVYDVVFTDGVYGSALYAYTDVPDEAVFSAVKAEYGSNFDTAIRVFRIDGAEDEKTVYYLFPKVTNGEISNAVYAAVTKNGVFTGYADNCVDFLNGVSGLTSEGSPGYIVSCADTFFCVVGKTAYCTEIIWQEMDYLGEIVLPKSEISVVRVD